MVFSLREVKNKILVSIVAVLGLALITLGNDSVLWWQIDGNTAVGNTLLKNYDISEGSDGTYCPVIRGEEVYAARVRVVDGDYLFIYDGEGNLTDFSTTELYGPASGLVPPTTEVKAVELGNYASSQYSFIIEIGNFNQHNEWTAVAATEAVGYNFLQTGGYLSTGGIYTQAQNFWAPTTMNIPEPTTGLLMLIGTGLLALRRKRRV